LDEFSELGSGHHQTHLVRQHDELRAVAGSELSSTLLTWVRAVAGLM
jgi:hypothetical protein